jgi:hypothetical protein
MNISEGRKGRLRHDDMVDGDVIGRRGMEGKGDDDVFTIVL